MTRISMFAAAISACLLVCAQAADLKRGQQLFNTCAACHSVLGDGVGPDITGIYGKPAARNPTFMYSPALRGSGLIWSEDTLRGFIANPQKFLPGTLMSFPGYSSNADIDDVIAYLKTYR